MRAIFYAAVTAALFPILTIGCGGSDEFRQVPTSRSPTPLISTTPETSPTMAIFPRDFVDFDEAEALGLELIFPSYVTAGLEVPTLATVSMEDGRAVDGSIEYRFDPAHTQDEPVLSHLTILFIPDSDEPHTVTEDIVQIAGRSVSIGGIVQLGKEIVSSSWIEGEQEIFVAAYGREGIDRETVREEALKIIASMLDS